MAPVEIADPSYAIREGDLLDCLPSASSHIDKYKSAYSKSSRLKLVVESFFLPASPFWDGSLRKIGSTSRFC